MTRVLLPVIVLLLIICTAFCGCTSPSGYTPGGSSPAVPTVSPSVAAPVLVGNHPDTPVSAEERERAREAVYRFTHSCTTALDYERTENFGNGDQLTFTGASGTFTADNTTGRVRFAHMKYPSVPDTPKVSRDEAFRIAESFAKDHFPILWNASYGRSVNLTCQDQTDGSPEADYSFVWRDVWQSPDPAHPYTIIGLTSVYTRVDPQGHVTMYSESYSPEDPSVNLTPALAESDAWEIAKRYFTSRGISSYPPEEISHRGLWVYDDAANDLPWPKYGKQYLAWVFYIKHRSVSGELLGGMIFIDAHDGHIINNDEIL